MLGLSSRAVGCACALALAAASAPSTAVAIPWDKGGAVPPERTPAPDRGDPNCLQSYADDGARAGPRIRFGIGPRLAGEAGGAQSVPAVAESEERRDAALRRLRDHRELAVRLNRLFMSEGDAGISEFKRLARRFGRLGLDVELQVRYHPAGPDNGDIGKWLRFVRKVVRELGPNRHVTGLQIANEVNIAASPNTSDGFYDRAVEALSRGVIAASREAHRRGYDRIEVGFNYAWRFDFIDPSSDARFWEEVGRVGGRRLRRHTDWVGIDAYPGTWVPGQFVPATVVDYGDALLEGIAQTRECFMPKAGFTAATPLRIEEIGYATGPGRSELAQAEAAREFVRAANRYRGTYGITDLRWFNLRDNDSAGARFEQHFGLLRSDYTAKPAFGVYRGLVRRLGARR